MGLLSVMESWGAWGAERGEILGQVELGIHRSEAVGMVRSED